jgi:hypothetical protein
MTAEGARAGAPLKQTEHVTDHPVQMPASLNLSGHVGLIGFYGLEA